MTRVFEQAVQTRVRDAETSSRWVVRSRRALGAFFCAMAAYNVLVVLPDAATAYGDIADGLAWPGIDTVMRELVVPVAALFTVGVAAVEALVGTLMIRGGREGRIALWCAAAFMTGLFPVVSYYAFANVPLVVLALVLLRMERPEAARA